MPPRSRKRDSVVCASHDIERHACLKAGIISQALNEHRSLTGNDVVFIQNGVVKALSKHPLPIVHRNLLGNCGTGIFSRSALQFAQYLVKIRLRLLRIFFFSLRPTHFRNGKHRFIASLLCDGKRFNGSHGRVLRPCRTRKQRQRHRRRKGQSARRPAHFLHVSTLLYRMRITQDGPSLTNPEMLLPMPPKECQKRFS